MSTLIIEGILLLILFVDLLLLKYAVEELWETTDYYKNRDKYEAKIDEVRKAVSHTLKQNGLR